MISAQVSDNYKYKRLKNTYVFDSWQVLVGTLLTLVVLAAYVHAIYTMTWGWRDWLKKSLERGNAKEMADLGAAVEIRDVVLAPKQSSPNTAGQKNDGEPAPRRHVRLEYVIGELLYDTEVLAGMRESCLDAAHPEAADAIANDVVSIALAARRKRRGSKAAA